MITIDGADSYCTGCVYYPPNLPETAYAPDDYCMLQAKTCAFDFRPADSQCAVTRKTSCALVDLHGNGQNN